MGTIYDLNVTNIEIGKFRSGLGTAHEYIVTGILMRLGFDISVASGKGGPYDTLIAVFEGSPGSAQNLIRAQVRTVNPNGVLSFVAGRRGGINREYISGVKEYVYTTEHNDLIIGVDPNTLDLYLVPTIFVEWLGQKSITIRKLQHLKNNWDILLNWNPAYQERLFSEIA